MANNNTVDDENFNDDIKVTSRIPVTEEKAEEILALLGGTYPPIEDIGEITFIITR
jgi:hypothetical protein